MKNSIAWRTAIKIKEQGGDFVLTNAPVALRMGSMNKLAEETSSENNFLQMLLKLMI